MSDMTGIKATRIEAHCRERGQAYVRFDYLGHGASSEQGSTEDNREVEQELAHVLPASAAGALTGGRHDCGAGFPACSLLRQAQSLHDNRR